MEITKHESSHVCPFTWISVAVVFRASCRGRWRRWSCTWSSTHRLLSWTSSSTACAPSWPTLAFDSATPPPRCWTPTAWQNWSKLSAACKLQASRVGVLPAGVGGQLCVLLLLFFSSEKWFEMISVCFAHIFYIFIHNDRLFMVPQTIRAWGAYKGLQIWGGGGGALCEIYLITSNKNVKFVLTDLKEGGKSVIQYSLFLFSFWY